MNYLESEQIARDRISELVATMLAAMRTNRRTGHLNDYSNVYATNSTMTMLGFQTPFGLITSGGLATDDFHNLFEAYKETYEEHMLEHMADMVQDAFLLGYIHGKRAERARKTVA